MKPIALATLLALAASPVMSQDIAKPVKLITVNEEQTDQVREFFGQVVARQTVDLAFQVGGQVQKLPVIEGETLTRGDLVAELDLEAFELAYQQAVLEKEQADRTLTRLEKLAGSTVSQVAIDDARTEAALASIAVTNAENALEDATLVAPFDALVAHREIANFTTVGAGQPVVRLHDMSELRVEIKVPEVLVQRTGRAEDIEITAKFPALTDTYPLTVREIQAEAETIGQTYRVTLGFTPPEGVSILPGSSVAVTTRLTGASKGLIVPITAIGIEPDGTTYVYRFDPKGAAEGTITKVVVQVTPSDAGGVLVTDGLSLGDEIVAAGLTPLSDGMPASRFTGFGN